jgi:ribosome biogenesis GTPase
MSHNVDSFAARGLVVARVITSQRDRYRLAVNDIELTAEPTGTLWHRAPTRAAMPVTGDWVAARIVGEGQAIVEEVLPRRTVFSRRAAGRREDEQPVAANIDLVFLISGLDDDFNPRRIERYLTLAMECRAEPVIVLNKSDACSNLAERIAAAAAVSAGAQVVPTSTRTPGGLDALRSFLTPGITVALLGSSGVGKSSIVNALTGEERLQTAQVRASDSRGRHTTTHRELIALPNGAFLIDTPGMRELQLWASEESVDAVFDEVTALASECRYRDCTHSGEPACAVEAALSAGTLAPERVASYRKLQGEARHHEVMSDPLAAQERRRKWKIIHKAMRRRDRQGL